MSNITIQRAGELLRSVFEILWDKPDGLTAMQVLAVLPKLTSLTEHELEHSPTLNLRKYEKIIRLATILLVHAGWLVKNEKGRWFITEAGYQACNQFVNEQEFYQEALRLYSEHKRVESERIMALEIAQESAWAQIEKHLINLKNTELQSMTVELLRAMGYFPSWMAPPEKHRGHIDIISFTDPLRAKGQRIVTQIIQQGQPVTLLVLNRFLSILGPKDFGMIISICGFTQDTIQELSAEQFEKVTALDSNSFFELWKKYYTELSQETRHLLPVKAVHFLSHFN